MKEIKYLIVHHADSYWGNANIIRKWHMEPPRNWKDIGYNGIIQNGHWQENGSYNKKYDGMFEEGRALNFDAYIDEDEKAAHALGYNAHSVGIALVGRRRFTIPQFRTLIYICKVFRKVCRDIEVIGHYECKKSNKKCPGFSMVNFRELLSGHIFTDDTIKYKMGDWL